MAKLAAALMMSAAYLAPADRAGGVPAQEASKSAQDVSSGPPGSSGLRRHHRPQHRIRRGGTNDTVQADDDDLAELTEGDIGQLVPDPQVCREFGVTSMTLWRWDRDTELIALGWPSPPIKIRRRKFRPRSRLDEFKRAVMRRAIAQRGAQRSGDRS